MSEENSETEEEEYEVEDYYKEVKRFWELTKEEIDIVKGGPQKTSHLKSVNCLFILAPKL